MNSSIAGIDECDRISGEIFGKGRAPGRTPAYSVSKAAVNMLAQQWARALPDIVVIAIHPCAGLALIPSDHAAASSRPT